DDTQYYNTYTDSADALHYTFAHLEQRTLSLTWRLDYAFTPNATLQLRVALRLQRDVHERARAGGSARGGLRGALPAVRRHHRYRRPRRVQRAAVPVESRVSLGISRRLDAVSRVDPGARRLLSGPGDALLRRRPARAVRPTVERHLPHQALVLVRAVGDARLRLAYLLRRRTPAAQTIAGPAA